MKTSSGHPGGGMGPLAAAAGPFRLPEMMLCPSRRAPGGGFWGRPPLPPLLHPGPSAIPQHRLQRPPSSTQRCWGCAGAQPGDCPPPLGTAGLPLLGGFFSFCHCSRSIPLIAVNYFGINGDVLCSSTVNEAARMNKPANISW